MKALRTKADFTADTLPVVSPGSVHVDERPDARCAIVGTRGRGGEKLSLEQCRNELGSVCRLSDSDILRLRDQLYNVAQVIVTLLPDPSARESIEERAAIMEFDDGLSREAAIQGAVIRNIRGRR